LACTHTHFKIRNTLLDFFSVFFVQRIFCNHHKLLFQATTTWYFWQKWTKYFIIGLIKEFYCVFLHKLSTLETLNFLDLNMICSNVSSFSSRCWLRWLASFFLPSFNFNVGVSLLSISLKWRKYNNFSLVLRENS